MSPVASHGEPQSALGLPSPREIRAQLPPEQVEGFDRDFRKVMAEATEALDLAPVREMLRRWARVAALTQADPQEHRRMLLMDAARNAGEDVPMKPWQEIKRELGL